MKHNNKIIQIGREICEVNENTTREHYRSPVLELLCFIFVIVKSLTLRV